MIFITLNTKHIETASFAGFCYGVKRAVETTKKIKKENPNSTVYVLGELIHNQAVINELDELGIITVEKLPETAPDNAICIIRSHGESMDNIDDIEQRGYIVFDLTCPDVKKVQDTAVKIIKDGYFLIILGKREHPEVMAIESNAKRYSFDKNKVLVAGSLEDLIKNEKLIESEKKIGVVVQTTQKIELLKEVSSYLAEKTKELKVFNTICHSTNLRQKQTIELAKKSDLVVVAGSKKSANTTHLADIAKEYTNTLHIESDKELDLYKDVIKSANTIGITAGASTPDYIIKQVENKIKTL